MDAWGRVAGRARAFLRARNYYATTTCYLCVVALSMAVVGRR